MKSCFVDDGSTSVPSQKTSNGMMIHEQAEDMPHLPVARFTRRKSDNALLAFSCQFSSKQDPPAVYISHDEGKTWSAPVVIARNPHGEVSYPYLFEPEPGTLWVTAHRFGLKMQIEVCDIFD